MTCRNLNHWFLNERLRLKELYVVEYPKNSRRSESHVEESLERDIILQHFYNTLNIILQHVYNVLVLSYGGSKFFSLFYFLIVKIL